MDTACYCCQWLLWTTLMLMLHHYQEVSGSPRECPQGQLVHRQTRPHSVTCCFPVRCIVGEEVRPCTRNQTQDTCQKCEMHQNQSLRTSSYTMDRCIDWPLDWECKNINNPDKHRDMQDELTQRCMCNIEQGMMFYPPESDILGSPMDSYCQRINEQCKPGFEPRVNGTCQPCQQNYFKSGVGYNLCEPKTDCNLLGLKFISTSNATADNVCSQSEPMITKPSITQRTYSTATTPKTTTEISRQPNTSVSTTSWHDEGVYVSTTQGSAVRQAEDKILWPIVGSLLALVAILVCVGLVMYCCRRRRLLVCVYAAAKDCADAEDNHGQGSTYDSVDCQVKLPTANGSTSYQNLIRGDRNMSNGGVPLGIEDLPNGHVHPNILHGDFNQTEYGQTDGLHHTNPHQYRSLIPPRPGLRTGGRHVMFSQRQDNWPDLSLDIMGQNTRQTPPVDGFEANPELGESDCLLISEHPHGIGAHQMANSAGSSGSPAVLHNGFNPMQILPLNDCRDTNFAQNGPFLPPLNPYGRAVSVDGVTFTRSVSLIASPEGEIDEEERAALFPRFSQLLQEGDDSLSSESTTVLNPPNHHQPATQRPADFPPLLAASVPQKDFRANQPDHSIMYLKEQDLVGSMHPPTSKSCPPDKLKHVADLTSTPNLTPAVPEEAQQTQLKTLGCSQVLSNSSDSGNMNTNRTSHSPEYLENKQSDTEGISHNLADRKRQISGGVNSQVSEKKCTDFQNCSDWKRVPSGGSSVQTILEHRTGDSHQAPCIRTSPPEERDASRDRQQLNNRVVFFGNGENLHTGNKQPSPRADLWQSARSQSSSEAASTNNSKTFRSASDPEKANTAQANSDAEESEWNPDSHKVNTSKTSSKTSVNSDFTDDGNGNPTSAVYRRSQSQNTPSISESPHKPPPRSMSEEKPQKLDRPVAKVKPMPASDSSVNQLPLEVPGDSGPLPQPLVCAMPTNNNHLSSSTEDFDQEQYMEMDCEPPSSTLEEDEGQEAENGL